MTASTLADRPTTRSTAPTTVTSAEPLPLGLDELAAIVEAARQPDLRQLEGLNASLLDELDAARQRFARLHGTHAGLAAELELVRQRLTRVEAEAAGVPASDPALEKAVSWLKKNQRESGRWWTRSLNTDRYHFITYSGTCYPLLALARCGALPRQEP